MKLQRAALSRFLLIDAGPMVALIDADDPAHGMVVEAVKRLPRMQLLTTWPCLAEAMYLLGTIAGYRFQEALWDYLTNDLIEIHDLSRLERVRMRELMAKYSDTPMDLADASLVAAAESLRLRRVFTLDDDFYLYRLADGAVLEVIR